MHFGPFRSAIPTPVDPLAWVNDLPEIERDVALRIVNALAQPGANRLTEIAARAGATYSTTRRTLGKLVRRGVVGGVRRVEYRTTRTGEFGAGSGKSRRRTEVDVTYFLSETVG